MQSGKIMEPNYIDYSSYSLSPSTKNLFYICLLNDGQLSTFLTFRA